MERLLVLAVFLLTVSHAASLHAQQDSQVEKAETFHDADPRNTQTSFGFAADQDGELKVSAGGGGANLYGGDEIQTQTIIYAEYFTQTEQARLRMANFDERFGGIYLDLGLQDIIDMYTVGYMLPLQAFESSLMFFPSLNYTRVEFDSDEAADAVLDAAGGRIEIDGVEYSRDAIADIITNIALEGSDSSDVASLNVYAMMPWNETHFSMLQITSGSSYGGFDMELVDMYFMQGIRAQLGANVVNIYFELQHTETTIQGVETDSEHAAVGITFKI
ncbi:MAG: hypothetical protein HRU21_10785 [Pseudomonadales bacterium]|nr:hypothetical protein [Pseudomonadales bacterium]